METEVNIEGPGRTVWRIENRQQHYGLDAEYLPAFFTGPTIEKTLHALRRTNYASAVRTTPDGGPGAFYAWYADRGDWELQMYKDQVNAFQPLAPCEWMRTLSHRAMVEVPTFTDVDRMRGGATGVLVTWCPWPDKGIPCKRQGEHARAWSLWNTAVFMYLSNAASGDDKDKGDGNDKDGEERTREIVLSPASHPLARAHFQSDEIEKTHQKSVRFKMGHGSLLILRGSSSHAFWDMTHLPSPVPSNTTDATPTSRYDGGDFFLEFESIHPLKYLEERRHRPPIRTREGIAEELRFTPLFFNYDAHPAPLVCVPNEQPLPPPPVKAESPVKTKKKAAAPRKKRAPAKKRARSPQPQQSQSQGEDE